MTAAGTTAAQLLLTQMAAGGETTFADVVFLCGFDGTDTSGDPIDESNYGHDIKVQANRGQLEASPTKFGVGSWLGQAQVGVAFFEAGYDSSIPPHFQFGDGSFCLEGFFRFSVASGSLILCGLYRTDGGTPKQSYRVTASWSGSTILLTFNYSTDGTTQFTNEYYSVGRSAGVWYHWVVERDNLQIIRAFLEGDILHNTFDESTEEAFPELLFAANEPFTFGFHPFITGSGSHTGLHHQDEIRITRGAWYGDVETYVVPTTLFPRNGVGGIAAAVGSAVGIGSMSGISQAGTAIGTAAGTGAALASAQTILARGAAATGAGAATAVGADAGVPWTPAALGADVITWWDFSNQSNLTLSGSSITAVDDLSSANEASIISGTTNQQPTSSTVSDWGGLYGAVFNPGDGGSDQIAAANGVAQPWGCAIIFKTGASIAELETLFGSTVTTQVALKYSGVSNNPYTFAGSAATRWASNLSTSTNYIDITTFNGASSLTRINGTAGSAYSPGTASESAANLGIGRFNGSWGASQCTYGEVLFFNRVLTTLEMQKIEGYLAHKFSRTADLPGGHPYKTNPPLV